MTQLTKTSNGVEVPLSPEEEAEFYQREQDYLKEREAYKKVEYLDKRREALMERGCSDGEMISALWDRLIDNKPEKSDALQIIREQVFIDFPPPA